MGNRYNLESWYQCTREDGAPGELALSLPVCISTGQEKGRMPTQGQDNIGPHSAKLLSQYIDPFLESFVWPSAASVDEEVLELVIGWPVLAYVTNEALAAYEVGLDPPL
jgi:hypothetical protein